MPVDAYERLKRELRKLAVEPRPSGARKLSAREGWRLAGHHLGLTTRPMVLKIIARSSARLCWRRYSRLSRSLCGIIS